MSTCWFCNEPITPENEVVLTEAHATAIGLSFLTRMEYGMTPAEYAHAIEDSLKPDGKLRMDRGCPTAMVYPIYTR